MKVFMEAEREIQLKKLEGKRIVIAGTRKLEEISKLIENQGGIPLLRATQGTTVLDDSNIEVEITNLIAGSYEWLVFTTGMGLNILLDTAERMGKREELVETMRTSNVAARGYKTVNVLRGLGITPLVRDDDGSTAGLVRSLNSCEEFHDGSSVALQLHGDPAPLLITFLQERNCQYHEVLPYLHTPPSDAVLLLLLDEVLTGKVDAVSFTSTPQVRFLFDYAASCGKLKDLLAKFETEVVALAVGKVTAQALKEQGVQRVIFPEHERMGSAIIELAKYYTN